jgi:hypothetical protein
VADLTPFFVLTSPTLQSAARTIFFAAFSFLPLRFPEGRSRHLQQSIFAIFNI